ncbi:MAG: low affinity iron permease family protein [Actinomycetota bacterium]
MGEGARSGRTHTVFAEFATFVARWTGNHWAFAVAAALVVISLVAFGVEVTNTWISVVILLMVFILQNTQNRDSAALHLKLDEVVRVEPEARDDVRGVESKSKEEIEDLHVEEDEASPSDVEAMKGP